jgi:hypothetical protein
MEPTEKEIIASMEGMKVVVADRCELHEYNFDTNKWFQIDSCVRPMKRSQAEEWLTGWNSVDRFAALGALISRPER